MLLLATARSTDTGALAAAAAVGPRWSGGTPDEVVAGFPGTLSVSLAGVIYLFALAEDSGTVDWTVRASVGAARGRVALVPRAMLAICAVTAAVGAAIPATVAIVAIVVLAPLGTWLLLVVPGWL